LIPYFKEESNLKESQKLSENSDAEKHSLLTRFVSLPSFQEVKEEVKGKFFISILKTLLGLRE
jgi:hypothetical protein